MMSPSLSHATSEMSAPSQPQHESSSATSQPVKKRRRPALACEQCRRRKIRCDRNAPCNHCIKSKISNCSYVPTHVPASWAKKGKDPSKIRDAQGSNEPSQQFILPAPSKDKGTPPSSEYIHPNSSQWLNSVTGSNTRASSVSASGAGSMNKGSPNDVEWLKSRLHYLEEKLGGVDMTSADEDEPYEKSPAGTESTAPIKGTVSKTRYFGRSHWMNGAALLPLEMKLLTRAEFEKGPLSNLLTKCKSLGRTIKERRLAPLSSISLCQTIPHRPLADALVNAYLRTFEGVLRILHVPSFMMEYERYWEHPSSASDFFKIQLQLVMALGTPFYDELNTLRKKATQWIYEAQLWLMLPPEKSRMTIAGIQIMCLLALARSACATGQDLVWVTTGGLVRKAMFMGLHRDPRHLADMTTYRAEMRRRLWATILELNLQSSFDAGGPPLISPMDYDVLPPANLDDSELDDRLDRERPTVRTSDRVTQMSIPIELLKSLPLRLLVLRHANDFRLEDSYDDTLRFNSELTKHCRSLSKVVGSFLKNQRDSPWPKVSEFHTSLAELFLYRCFHTLHQPVLSRRLNDPKFYFSRKMYLDGALKISHICGLSGNRKTAQSSTTSSPGVETPHPDLERLLNNTSGVFRNIPIQCQPAIVLELLGNRSGEQSPLGLGYLPAIHDYDLHSTVEAYRAWTLRRIRSGETNIKGHVYSTSCIHHIAAVDAGLDEAGIEAAILKGAEEAGLKCFETMKELAQREGILGCGEEPKDLVGGGESNTELFGMVGTDTVDMGMGFDIDDWGWDEMTGLLWGSPRPFEDVHPPIFG